MHVLFLHLHQCSPHQQRAMASTVKHGQGTETKPVVVRKLGIK